MIRRIAWNNYQFQQELKLIINSYSSMEENKISNLKFDFFESNEAHTFECYFFIIMFDVEKYTFNICLNNSNLKKEISFNSLIMNYSKFKTIIEFFIRQINYIDIENL